jgi:hypothetical protein
VRTLEGGVKISTDIVDVGAPAVSLDVHIQVAISATHTAVSTIAGLVPLGLIEHVEDDLLVGGQCDQGFLSHIVSHGLLDASNEWLQVGVVDRLKMGVVSGWWPPARDKRMEYNAQHRYDLRSPSLPSR